MKKGLVLFKYGLQDAVVDFISIHNAVQAHFLASTALLDPARMDVVVRRLFWIAELLQQHLDLCVNFLFFFCHPREVKLILLMMDSLLQILSTLLVS